MNRPLPAFFTSIDHALPPEGKPVLAIRRSCVTSPHFEILTARYLPSCRPLAPWQTLDNDSVRDSGADILGSTYAAALAID